MTMAVFPANRPTTVSVLMLMTATSPARGACRGSGITGPEAICPAGYRDNLQMTAVFRIAGTFVPSEWSCQDGY